MRLQDIADMVGVSRTTVSNVIHGNTKRVSKQTRDKIAAILQEVDYVPHMGASLLGKSSSRIIGVVLGYEESHGYSVMEDPFIGKLLGALQEAAHKAGYYLMLIGGEKQETIIDIASRWSVDGLLILGLYEEQLLRLCRHLNKPMVSIDVYCTPRSQLRNMGNVGIDDFGGGYQMGRFFAALGLKDAIFVSENLVDSDYRRWRGFQRGMEEAGVVCGQERVLVVPSDAQLRGNLYNELLEQLLRSRALFFSSDFLAVEAISFLHDRGIHVPGQVSVAGFDDTRYATLIRPQLTTIRQDIAQKAALAFVKLVRLINNEADETAQVSIPVELVIRDSVKGIRDRDRTLQDRS